MSDHQRSYAATVTSKPPIGLRSFTQEALSIAIIAICSAVAFLLVDVKTALVKHNELIEKQIFVTRSLHNVQELATAYLEGRRASEAAEKAGVPPEPENKFKDKLDFLR